LSAGEREEIQKMKVRIKAITAGKELSARQQKVLKDADENDTHRAGLYFLEEEVQQAMEDEVKAKMAAFCVNLIPTLELYQAALNKKVLESVKANYKSLDPSFLGDLERELKEGSKDVSSEEIEKILVKGASGQIASEVTEALISTVGTASDLVFAKLYEDLENILTGVKEGKPEPIPSSAKGQDGGGIKGGTSSGGKGAPPRVLPKPPPVPPKDRKESVGEPPKSPQVAEEGSPGSKIGDAPLKRSNIGSHLTKERPMGPKRRRPVRIPQARPMMNATEV